MKKFIIAALIPLNIPAQARTNPNYDYVVASDCVYVGAFQKIKSIDAGETAPFSLSLGQFKVSKAEKSTHYICDAYKDMFDVLLSDGKSKKIKSFENCSLPEIGVKYRVGLKVILDGTFVPVSCPLWLKKI